MHTRQSVFDTVATALITQGKPALAETGGMCMYRAPGGGKCGIGHLIPDAEYNDEIEGTGIQGIFGQRLPIGPTVTAIAAIVEERFLASLQAAHDNASKDMRSDFVTAFKGRMSDLAQKYELNPASVEG